MDRLLEPVVPAIYDEPARRDCFSGGLGDFATAPASAFRNVGASGQSIREGLAKLLQVVEQAAVNDDLPVFPGGKTPVERRALVFRGMAILGEGRDEFCAGCRVRL